MVSSSALTPAPECVGVSKETRQENRGSTEVVRRSPGTHRPDLIARLKAGIAALEGTACRFEAELPAGAPQPWTPGLDALDARLPGTGLDPAGVHAVLPATVLDIAAAMGFAAALGVRRLLALGSSDDRPVLWVRQSPMVREAGRLHGHGLARLGLPHRRLVTVSLKKPASVLWTMEEALKSGTLAAVIADVDPARLDLATVRRLVLAAAAGTTPAILSLPRPCAEAVAGTHSRWQVTSAPSAPDPLDPEAPGHPTWTIELQRCRGGRPGTASAEWHHASHRFSVAAALPGGTAGEGPPQDRPAATTRSRALRAG